MRGLILSLPILIALAANAPTRAGEPEFEPPPYPPYPSYPSYPPVLVSPQSPASIVPDYLVRSPATPVGPGFVASPKAYSPWAEKWRTKVAVHRRDPSGIPMPIGGSNAWTEFKFVFGSARQYFGTAESAQGVWHRTTVPPPNRYDP